MVTPKILYKFYDAMETKARNAGIIAGKSGRHMKYPYTFSAKIAQFPFFYYMKNNNIWMYYPLGIGLSFYLFTYLHAMSNSDGNKRSWAESQARIAEKEAHH